MTQETLREAVARALCELHIRTVRRHDTPPDKLEAMLPSAVNHVWREHLPQADAVIATMFERLRTPSEGMIEAVQDCGPIGCCIIHEYEARGIIDAVATAFQQENSDATERPIATRLHPDNPHGGGAWE